MLVEILALAAAIAACLVTDLAVPLVVRLAHTLRALSYPGKMPMVGTPRLGGVAVVAGVACGGVGVALASWSTSLAFRISRSEVIALALASSLVFLVSVVDDILGVSSFKKFGVQALAAVLLVHVGWSFRVLSLPDGHNLDLGIFGPVLTVVWIAGVTNAVNLIDGLGGLAASVVPIIAASLLVYALLLGNPGTVILMAAMIGACLGFIRHNWAPVKIFMGDSGSLTLGFLLCALAVHSSLKAPPAAIVIVVPVLALGLQVLANMLVMRVRFLARSANRLLQPFAVLPRPESAPRRKGPRGSDAPLH
jgi:UDP-GlcNAc:undecaprenyl-phosphate GlcNAc-1-phosphate transferase